MLALAGLLGCEDPSLEKTRAALGPEAPGIERGPLHRAGQPCLACHDGSEARAFSLAGTAYVDPEGKQPLVDGVVTMVDARGLTVTAATNCAGNFFIFPEDFEPIYPVKARLDLGTQGVAMESLIQRDGSCNSCHAPTPGPRSAGPIYLSRLPVTPAPRVCP